MDTNAERKPQWIDTVDPIQLRDAMAMAIADMEKAQAVVEQNVPGSILLFELECGVFMATLDHVERCKGLFRPLDSFKGKPAYAVVQAMYEKSLVRVEHLGIGFDAFYVQRAAIAAFLRCALRESVRVFTCRLKSHDTVNVILELGFVNGGVVARQVCETRVN